MRRTYTVCGECGRPHRLETLTCAQCLAYHRHYYQTVMRDRAQPAAGPNLIAHCGQWHTLTTLPWACPACDTILGLCLEDTGDTP